MALLATEDELSRRTLRRLARKGTTRGAGGGVSESAARRVFGRGPGGEVQAALRDRIS